MTVTMQYTNFILLTNLCNSYTINNKVLEKQFSIIERYRKIWRKEKFSNYKPSLQKTLDGSKIYKNLNFLMENMSLWFSPIFPQSIRNILIETLITLHLEYRCIYLDVSQGCDSDVYTYIP